MSIDMRGAAPVPESISSILSNLNTEMESSLNDLIKLSYQQLIELKQITLHQGSLSDADIDEEGVEE